MKLSDSIFALSVKLAVCTAPTLTTVFFPSSATPSTISSPQDLNLPSDFPYTKQLSGLNLLDVLPITSTHYYPLGISNGTHYYLYFIEAAGLSGGVDSGLSIWTQINETRIYKVKEGAAAWKKRDEASGFGGLVSSLLSRWNKRSESQDGSQGKPWLWWRPFPGASAW